MMIHLEHLFRRPCLHDANKLLVSVARCPRRRQDKYGRIKRDDDECIPRGAANLAADHATYRRDTL